MAQAQKIEKNYQLNNTEELEMECIETDLQPYGTFYNIIYKVVQFFASTFLGLFFIKKLSSALEVVEKTAKWGLPQRGDDAQIVLERPLSWLPFIALIIFLRTVQTMLSVASVLIGNNPVQMRDIIYFLQTRRRKLRALRNQGYRSVNDSQLDNSLDISKNESAGDILKKMLSTSAYRSILENDISTELLSPIKSQTPATNKSEINRKTLKRWSPEQCANETLSVDKMLEKFASLDSDDDSDFLPEADLNSLNSSSTNTTSSSCTDQSESPRDHSQNETGPKQKPTEEKNPGIKENGDQAFSTQKQNTDGKAEKLSSANIGNKQQQYISKAGTKETSKPEPDASKKQIPKQKQFNKTYNSSKPSKKKAALNGSPLRGQPDMSKLSPDHENGALANSPPKGESPNINNTTFEFNSNIQTSDSTLISNAVKESSSYAPTHSGLVNDNQLPTTTL